MANSKFVTWAVPVVPVVPVVKFDSPEAKRAARSLGSHLAKMSVGEVSLLAVLPCQAVAVAMAKTWDI